jgi:Protein of unknown function (DUF3431)
MFLRVRLRHYTAVLVAIVVTFLVAVELLGDEVVRVVTEERIQQMPRLLREEMDSLDADPPPESQVQSSRTFTKEDPMHLGYNYTRTIVMGKRSADNTDWINEEVFGMEKAIYVVDNKTASLHVPKNKGNEAMVYLSYIIDHYDILSDITIFIHADRWTWHNNDIFDSDTAMMIKHLIPQRVIREGYVNLRCQWYPGCPTWLNPSATTANSEKREEKLIHSVWPHLFPDDELPTALAQPCCSQFALSRARIRDVPREEYVRLRRWLLSTRIADDLVGRVFEYAWQYLWIGRAVVCPSAHACSCDLYGACFDDDEDYQSWFELRYWVRRAEWELISWEESEARLEEAGFAGAGAAVAGMARRKMVEKVTKPPPGRIEELKRDIDKKWMRLLEKRDIALKNGRDPKWRARIATRDLDVGDDGDTTS